MKKDNIPWFFPKTGDSEKKLIIKVIESNYLNDGDYTRLFEKKVAELIGVRYCVGVSSGTAAIALALMGMGIGEGDEVIVPDLTFIATANAVRLTGAKVRLLDIEPHRFAIETELIKKNIGSCTKAIVPVDVNGRAAAYELLEPLAKKMGLALICDSTEGLGSRYRGRYLGSFGDAGCFSFSANKTVTTGQGGMVATNNARLYHRLLELKDQGRRFQGTGGNDLHPVMGYNFKLTNLQAAVGIAQLNRLPKRLSQAQKRDKWYQEELSGCPGIVLPSLKNKKGETNQWADILVDDRRKIEMVLFRHGIRVRPFWYPLHTQKPYLIKNNRFSNASAVSDRGLWLPSFFDLTKEQAAKVSRLIRGILEKK